MSAINWREMPIEDCHKRALKMEGMRLWRAANREHVRKYNKSYLAKRYADPEVRARVLLRQRLYYAESREQRLAAYKQRVAAFTPEERERRRAMKRAAEAKRRFPDWLVGRLPANVRVVAVRAMELADG